MALWLALGSLSLFYFLGYRGWSKILIEKVFNLSNEEKTPAHNPSLKDNLDYLPVQKHILWGHHYTSIAGAAPIIGPAVAVFWGWFPALLWVVFGTIFIGAVHDFGALVISARHNGKTMGDISGEIIHPRVRLLFQIIIYFLIWIVLAVFSIAIAVLFTKYPESVIPVNFEIIIALIIGYLFYKKNIKILIPSILALIALYAMIPIGIQFPIILPENYLIMNSSLTTWAIILLIYAGIVALLPVWLLLQPRDFINSHQLIVGLIALIIGLIVLQPNMSAPAINMTPNDAPPLFPFIFVTIACGAISGFHGLVSSGTTSKQLNKIKDARLIGYGGMLGEGSLAVIATLAVAAGLPNWSEHYHSFNSNGINAISNFVMGAGNFLEALALPSIWAQSFIAILVISFAATSMDTAARIQRLIISEVGEVFNSSILKNRYGATCIAILPAIPLVILGKEAWGPLWMLFGTTNQLIGGMTFLILFIYLLKNNRPILHYAIPMVLVVSITTGAMIYNLVQWSLDLTLQTSTNGANWSTIIIGACILLLEIWMIVEAIIIIKKIYLKK